MQPYLEKRNNDFYWFSGTEFMVRLHEQLKYFVNKKISTDPGWQGIKIYLSGHEVIITNYSAMFFVMHLQLDTP